jgi:hypothetical protein
MVAPRDAVRARQAVARPRWYQLARRSAVRRRVVRHCQTRIAPARWALGSARSGFVLMTLPPRPFYLFGHNTNSFELATAALAAGANALEPDINVFKHRPDELCVSHGGPLGTGHGDDDEPALVPFLQLLREQAAVHRQLSLVVFDCKPATNTPDHGATLLDLSAMDRLDGAVHAALGRRA